MIKSAIGMQTWEAVGRRCKVLIEPHEIDPDVSVLMVEFDEGQGTPVHVHDAGLEFMYVVSGEGIAQEAGVDTPIKPHSVVVAEPGIPHAIINGDKGKMHMLCFYVPPFEDDYVPQRYQKVPDEFLK